MQDEDWGLWPAWFKAAGANAVEPAGPRLLHDLTLPAAEAGQGFALLDGIVSTDALAAGRLIRPYGVSVRSFGYYLVRKPGAEMSRTAAQFRDWLKAEIAETLSAGADGAFRTAPKPRSSLSRRRTAR